MLRSRESGISGKLIPQEKRLLEKKIPEQAEPVELEERGSGNDSGITVSQSQGYQNYSNLPHTEVDEEILKLEKEMQEESAKTLGLEQEQLKFDAQLDLMTPEQPVLPAEIHAMQEVHKIQDVDKIGSIDQGQQPEVKSKLTAKQQKMQEKIAKKEQKAELKAQKQEKAQPMTWIEKKQLEIQRKLAVLDQGMLSEPKKGRSA